MHSGLHVTESAILLNRTPLFEIKPRHQLHKSRRFLEELSITAFRYHFALLYDDDLVAT
jgi:hypothetical protein